MRNKFGAYVSQHCYAEVQPSTRQKLSSEEASEGKLRNDLHFESQYYVSQ
jgi:hypothetical protein